MVRSVALVHDDVEFRRAATAALRSAHYRVTCYDNSKQMLDDMEAHADINVLVTRFSFAAGMPNGASLALMLRTRYPALKVVFAARPEWKKHVEDI
jgi:FixJ family two-component response regulator